MNRPAKSTSRFLRSALLILLLAAQGFAVAHEFEHWDQPAQELCATCSLTSGLDAPLASDQPVPETTSGPSVIPEYRAAYLHETRLRFYLQRAPPFYL